jgi:hypothetical protein
MTIQPAKGSTSGSKIIGSQESEQTSLDQIFIRERPDADRIRILLLCNYDVTNAATVCDHINSFIRHSRHDVTVVSRLGFIHEAVNFDEFDVIVVHYSLTLAIDAYVSPATRHRLAEFQGLKVIFIQDEYRFVEKTENALRHCGIHVVYTVLPQDIVPKVYDIAALPGVQFVTTLTGFVPDWLKIYSAVPLASRSHDVGYRGRAYPVWHGKPALERVEIGRVFARKAKALKLRVNVGWSENDRLYGSDWVRFIRQCRAILSTESSIAVIDRSGQISNRYNAFVDLLGVQSADKPVNARALKLLGIHKPGDPDAWFDEMRKRFFAEQDGVVTISVISPRVFEAAALRTLLVMYEGEYSGILIPWRHYVPLKKDHSNIESVAGFVRDDVKCAEMISCCYAEIACNQDFSAARFLGRFDDLVESRMGEYAKSKSHSVSRESIMRTAPFFIVENPHGFSGRRRKWYFRLANIAFPWLGHAGIGAGAKRMLKAMSPRSRSSGL